MIAMPAPLTVCINAQLLDGSPGGVQQVVIGLAQGFSALADGEERYLFRTYADHADWLRPFVAGPGRIWESGRAPRPPGAGLPPPLRAGLKALVNGPLLWRLNARRKGRLAADDGSCARAGVEVVHFPFQDGFLTGLPTIFQPHDLQHLAMPENFTRAENRRRELVYRPLCAQAWASVVMTRWGKRDLVRRYGLPAERVAVVPPGVVTNGYPQPTDADLAALRRRLELTGDFLFYPAHTFPHKNHARLFEALAIVRAAGVPAGLVCSGGEGDCHARLQAQVRRLGLGDAVRFAGYVSPLEVVGLYRLARALVFPSLHEGWGLPLAEAMALGLPVACSDATCIPEQVGDAALIFDPLEPRSIAAAMTRIWSDDALRAELSAKGKARAAGLTWTRAARTFRALYRKAAGRASGEGDEALLEEAFRP